MTTIPQCSGIRGPLLGRNLRRLCQQNGLTQEEADQGSFEYHFPASTLAIASSVLRSRVGKRPPATAGLMAFSETPFRIIGAIFLVFPMVVFELRTTLLAINPRIPCRRRWGALRRITLT